MLAIAGMLAAVVLPALPTHTSRARLLAYATETAAVLKMDRDAARRRNASIETIASAPSRQIQSGASGRVVRIPRDVVVDTLLASVCNGRRTAERIHFHPSGRSCGGTVSLTIPGARYDIRVNWLTGGVEIVPVYPV